MGINGILSSFLDAKALKENCEVKKGTQLYLPAAPAGSEPAAAADTTLCLECEEHNAERRALCHPSPLRLPHGSGAVQPPRRCLSHRPGSEPICEWGQSWAKAFPRKSRSPASRNSTHGIRSHSVWQGEPQTHTSQQQGMRPDHPALELQLSESQEPSRRALLSSFLYRGST